MVEQNKSPPKDSITEPPSASTEEQWVSAPGFALHAIEGIGIVGWYHTSGPEAGRPCADQRSKMELRKGLSK
jgi:hypothetical protein